MELCVYPDFQGGISSDFSSGLGASKAGIIASEPKQIIRGYSSMPNCRETNHTRKISYHKENADRLHVVRRFHYARSLPRRNREMYEHELATNIPMIGMRFQTD